MDESMQEYKGDRRIWIKGELDGKILIDVITILNNIQEEDRNIHTPKPIEIYINSSGGEVNTGITIAKILLKMKAKIYTYNMGLCLSAALYIFLAGDKRYSFDHCSFLIHATTFGNNINNYTNIESYNTHVKDLIDMNNKFMLSRCKLSKEEIEKASLIDLWLNGVEAKYHNIVTDLI